MRVLLVSAYEMGHQPLGLAAPAAALRAAGHNVRCLDLAVDLPSPERVTEARLVAVSVPMHTAARLGIEFARRVRRLSPRAHIAFYGLYAAPLHDRLTLTGLADSVVGGEYEPGLVALADRLAAAGDAAHGTLPGVGSEPRFARQRYHVPDRRGLPPLDRYAHLDLDGEHRLAGYVEASRGCAHTCAHCPITPVYGGRLRLVQRETVLADVDQLVAMGACHITFGDPDFLNAVPHSLAIADAMHRHHPGITFDATTKVEHIIEHADVLPRLRALGCLFVTSAFESTNDELLRVLEKGHTRDDMERALEIAARAGIALRPTWMAFTPWTSSQDLVDLLTFVEEHGLVAHVQPVQYALRLLVLPGSPLVDRLRAQRLLGSFDAERLTYAWNSPDPRVDALQSELAAIVETAAAISHDHADERPEITFAKVKRATLRVLTGLDTVAAVAPQPRGAVPGLTEAWFCCAEPTEEQLAPLDRAFAL